MFKYLALIGVILCIGIFAPMISIGSDIANEVTEMFSPTVQKTSSVGGVHIPDEIWGAVPDGFVG